MTERYTIELVTFDIAGTTMADNGLVENAFMGAFEEHSIPAKYEELLPYRGSAKRPIVEAMVGKHCPDAEAGLVDAAMESFQSLIQIEMRRCAAPMPGAEATFAWLRERGIKIALTTGFDLEIKQLAVEVLGWDEAVLDAAVCSDEVPESRPAPWMIYEAMRRTNVQEATRAMAVGDTPRDLQAGTRAGCGGVVGVLSGSHHAVSLGMHRHTHIIQSVADLPALMQQEFRC